MWFCWRCATESKLWGFKGPCHSQLALFCLVAVCLGTKLSAPAPTSCVWCCCSPDGRVPTPWNRKHHYMLFSISSLAMESQSSNRKVTKAGCSKDGHDRMWLRAQRNQIPTHCCLDSSTVQTLWENNLSGSSKVKHKLDSTTTALETHPRDIKIKSTQTHIYSNIMLFPEVPFAITSTYNQNVYQYIDKKWHHFIRANPSTIQRDGLLLTDSLLGLISHMEVKKEALGRWFL